MLHLRIFVPPERADAAIATLRAVDGLHDLVHLPRAEVEHGDDLLTASVEPIVANEVVERLRRLRIERPGAVALVREDRTEVMPVEDDRIGYWDASADAIVVEEVVDEARENARLSSTYLAYMAAAGAVAGIGVGEDSSVLIVGAMAISPDLLPLSAICVGLVAHERRTVLVGVSTLLAGLAAAALVAGLLVRLADLADIIQADLGDNVLTTFVTQPSLATVIVALAAGVAAMLSIERQAASAVGVAISVTTIPAAAAIGVTLGLGDWDRMVGAAVVLAANLLALAVAGSLTLWVQLHRGHSIAGRSVRDASRRR
ncbi:MAG TPA: DUF389 domain-containing protein [Actinomycetota bacterium]|nr:DUF389 domain-containing protein [Actinomycetota bacterium]